MSWRWLHVPSFTQAGCGWVAGVKVSQQRGRSRGHLSHTDAEVHVVPSAGAQVESITMWDTALLYTVAHYVLCMCTYKIDLDSPLLAIQNNVVILCKWFVIIMLLFLFSTTRSIWERWWWLSKNLHLRGGSSFKTCRVSGQFVSLQFVHDSVHNEGSPL